MLNFSSLAADKPEPPEPPEPPFKTVAKGAFSGFQKAAEMVVTNQTQWGALWQEHSGQQEPKKAAPAIDFAKETVLFVALGQKNTGGHQIQIVDIIRRPGRTEVLVVRRKPAPGAMNLQALTAPFHIVRVPRIEGEVRFRTE